MELESDRSRNCRELKKIILRVQLQRLSGPFNGNSKYFVKNINYLSISFKVVFRFEINMYFLRLLSFT